MKLIDTHAHMDDEKYEGKLDSMIKNYVEEGMVLIINPSYDKASCERTIVLTEKYPMIYGAIGMHPHDAKDADEEFFSYIIEKTRNEKIVAVGEIGLDYYYDYSPRDVQKAVFKRQMEIAQDANLPVIIHCRDSHHDTYELLKTFKGKVKGVMHSYSGSWEMAKLYLDLGYYISFSGPITFKNSRKLPEVAANVPLDRIMIETDSPYLTPVPFRGKTNEPAYVQYVAQRVAQLKGISSEELVIKVIENTKALFTKI
ncbi:MAG: TatD family hydrolase [Eubacteriaceae bacterium]|nr:TatD family hydrolase [Eubacteriaceae bacterium]